MVEIENLLKIATEFHGERCPGIVLGTRMTIIGLRKLGLEPLTKNPGLVVYDEIDRCATDAIQAITGVSIGRRTLKHVNFGKFAATFVDTTRNTAVRVCLLPKWPHLPQDMIEFSQFVCNASDEELFRVQDVRVSIQPEDLPGFPAKRSDCSRCGEEILDGKEVMIEGKSVCQNCAHHPYFSLITT